MGTKHLMNEARETAHMPMQKHLIGCIVRHMSNGDRPRMEALSDAVREHLNYKMRWEHLSTLNELNVLAQDSEQVSLNMHQHIERVTGKPDRGGDFAEK